MSTSIITFVHKADGCAEDGVLRIEGVVEKLGEDSDWFNRARRMYANEARTIADLFFRLLPGGTINALLIELLTRTATVLRVPFPQDKVASVAPRADAQSEKTMSIAAFNEAFQAGCRAAEGEIFDYAKQEPAVGECHLRQIGEAPDAYWVLSYWMALDTPARMAEHGWRYWRRLPSFKQ